MALSARKLARGLLPHALALSALALAAAVIAWAPVRLDNLWWHMLTGRHLLEHGEVPTTDPFSYTAHGQPWVNWEWLGGLAMVLAYDSLGGAGLAALRWLATTATVMALWFHLIADSRRRQDGPTTLNPTLSLLLVGLALLVIYGRVSDRPHLYAMPLLAVIHLLAKRTFFERRMGSLVAEVVVMIPWVLIHPSWVLGVVLHAAVGLEAWLEDEGSPLVVGPPRRRWLYRASPLLLCIPGLALHDPGAYVSAVSSLFGASELREWQPLWTYLHWTNTPLIAFLIIGAAWLASIATAPRRLRAPTTWLAAALFVGSWWFVRFTPLFAIVAAPQIRAGLAVRYAKLETPARTAHLATGLVAALLLLVTVQTKTVFLTPYSTTVDHRENPVGVAVFMGRHDLGGNVLANEMNTNAFLAFVRYPDVHVYIDGRVPQLFSEEAWLRYLEALRSPERMSALLDETPTDHVVLQQVFSPTSVALCAMLAQRGDFSLVYFDEHAMLWTRRVKLEEHAGIQPYRIVVPPLIDERWFRQALEPDHFAEALEELRRFRGEHPGSAIGVTLVQTLAGHPTATAEQKAQLRELL